jgi:hypothetical protein
MIMKCPRVYVQMIVHVEGANASPTASGNHKGVIAPTYVLRLTAEKKSCYRYCEYCLENGL